MALWLVTPGHVSAQPAGGAPDETMDQPSEYGIRFTPEIARSLAGIYVQKLLQPRYELDASKVDEAKEAVARRLMQTAHLLDDEHCNVAFETMVTRMLKSQLGQGPERGGIQPEAGQAIGEAIGPLVPRIREMMHGTAQDIRPMLAPKQQLKFAADLIAADTAMDAFDKTMKQWAAGDVQMGGQIGGGPEQRDADGRSRALNRAEQRAEEEANKKPWKQWEEYVAQAKAFYQFDDAQSAAADSLLREAVEKAEQITADPQLHARIRDNRLLFNLLWPLRITSAHPLRYDVKRSYDEMFHPVRRLGEDLKLKVDAIATQGQQQMAQAKMQDWLAEAGYSDDLFQPEAADTPAATGEGVSREASTPAPANATAETP